MYHCFDSCAVLACRQLTIPVPLPCVCGHSAVRGRCGGVSGLCLVCLHQQRATIRSQIPAFLLTLVSTLLLRCVDINHANSWKRSYAERQAVNSVIQGTAADMAKRATIAVHEHIRLLHCTYNRPFPTLARLTLQVHDEIVLEVQRGLEAEVAVVVRRCMENVFVPPKGEAEARVPFPVSMKLGRTLGTMQPFELPREMKQPQQQQSSGAVASDVRDEVRVLLELAAVADDEWSDYGTATPASQQLRLSLASPSALC